METFVKENENGQTFYSELQLSEKVKEESKEYVSETKYKIDESKRLNINIINEINKLKYDNLELRSKGSNYRTQRSCISKDIIEMRTVAARVNDILETASKSSYMTSCEKEEYKNIIEKLEIKKIFIDNTLRESLKALKEKIKHKSDTVMHMKDINLQTIKEVKKEYAELNGKVKEIQEKIHELTKNKEINAKECDDIEEKLIKIRNENNQLQDCYDNKTKEIQEITKQIQEEEEQYHVELGKFKETVDQLETIKELEEKEISDLNVKCVELSKQNCEKQIKIEELARERTKLQANFEELSKKKQELEETTQRSITTLKNEASIYSQDMREKEEEFKLLKEYSLKIAQDQLVLRTQLEVESNESIIMEREISILKCENQPAEEQITEMIKENEEITLKISNMEKETDRLKNCKAAIKEEISSFKRQLEEKQKCYSEEMSNYNSKIKDALQVLDSKKAEEDQNIRNYTIEYEKITKDHAEAMAEYEQLNDKEIAKTEELEHKLKLANDEWTDANEENGRLRQEKTNVSTVDKQDVPQPTYSNKKDDDFYKLLLTSPKKRKFDECSDSSSVNTFTVTVDELCKMKLNPKKERRPEDEKWGKRKSRK
ncbi:uncharacterized protein PF11_0207-like [Agrilus planipennis]|uniref:Uncharacterized protein PF11_0207-like n=1 Tax=Agrilus planipennis TaxID=224129 RepID=A0A1W4X5G7_AGRPL|nr:uncharacterized protein PF11_0207-like [Agrilus planipennis]